MNNDQLAAGLVLGGFLILVGWVVAQIGMDNYSRRTRRAGSGISAVGATLITVLLLLVMLGVIR